MDGMETKEGSDGGTARLVRRLRGREKEIERSLVQLCAAREPTVVTDPDRSSRLWLGLAAVVGFSLACIERGEDGSEPIPSPAIAYARYAARNEGPLDDV